MTLYGIAIGGTGAKCAESAVHLTAAGLLDGEPLEILFVDQDAANGNVARAKKTATFYSRCYQLFKPHRPPQDWTWTWMRSEITVGDNVWSPMSGENQNLGKFFGYDTYPQNSKVKHLFDVLYSPEERKIPLIDGFRGRPAIGSAVMSNLERDPLWQTLTAKINADPRAKVFLFGSVFGGMGASGLPTISRFLRDKLKQDIPIGGLLVLPYFTFPPKGTTKVEQEIYADSGKFWLNAEVALRYYRVQAKSQEAQQSEKNHLGFDSIYLLGTPGLSKVSENFSLGRADQINRQHFIELYGGLAARDFVRSEPKNQVGFLLREEAEKIGWNDIPDGETVKKHLGSAARFAFAWSCLIHPQLTAPKLVVKNFADGNPWFERFFNSGHWLGGNSNLPQLEDEKADLEKIHRWSESYLDWLMHLHELDSETVNLFDREAFKEKNFAELIYGQKKTGGRQKHTVRRMLNVLAEKKPYRSGIIGLAMELYQLCTK